MKKYLSFILIVSLHFSPCKGYSVLTHEAIIDACWEKTLQPLLKQKYPASTPEQLQEAHAYAYGGAVAPDMGYYPFGSKFFTNLVHYVRSGDFVMALIEESNEINEYAFALGALCHYEADKYGHFIGTNQSVPLVYPKLKAKFGNSVTYEENKTAHIRMEFAFDVLQTARGNYASTAYHNYIGFKVSRSVLERAFRKTYDLDINSIFGNLSLAIETFRWSVKRLFPEMTKVAWVTKRQDILKKTPGITSRQFIFKMRNANYYQEYGKKHKGPGIFANFLSLLIRVLPKVGPLKALKFKDPGPQAEKLFIQSFDTVLLNYTNALKTTGHGKVFLPNIDFDTGQPTAPGEYQLTDQTYGKLLIKLSDKKFDSLSAPLKQNLLNFCNNLKPINKTKKAKEQWEKATDALEKLKRASTYYMHI